MNLSNVFAIIDLNHYYYRFMHVMLAKDDKALLKPNKQISLVKDVHASIVGDIYNCGLPISKIIITQDSPCGSWRKKITKYEDVAYKGNRSDRDSIAGIENLGKLMNGYCDILSKKGIATITAKNMEGDDIIKISVEYLLNNNISSVVFSGDGDMVQTLRKTNEAASFMYNTNKKKLLSCFKLYVPETKQVQEIETKELNEVFSDEDIFNLSSENIVTVKETNLDDIEVVDPICSLFAKLLAKETSDNIPSVYYYQKGTQTVSFTDLRAKEVYQSSYVGADYSLFGRLYSDVNERIILANHIYTLASGKPKTVKDKERIESEREGKTITIAANIKRNLIFVWLDEMVYRDNLRDTVNVSYEDVLDVIKIEINESSEDVVFDNQLLADTVYELRESNVIQSNESCLF